MDALTQERTTARLQREVATARAHTDALFRLVARQTLYERPIPDRHRLIFYVGHFDAFDWNQLGRGVLELPPFQPSFDRLFEAGIDPAPGQAPADQPSDWPELDEVLAYVGRTRTLIDEVWDEVPSERVLTALEHRWMHAVTLCYLLHELPPSRKRAPAAGPRGPDLESERRGDAWVRMAAGSAVLGQAAGSFGWDNEFPRHIVRVDGFEIARHKVTHRDYLRFVAAGGATPHFWAQRDGEWFLRRMFDTLPLPLDAPVYLTHQHATAYATWAGARPRQAKCRFSRPMSPFSARFSLRTWT